MENYYILNKETNKLELHFEKSIYQALPEEQKRDIKSNFLWGRNSGCWISRCKWPNLYYAEKCAQNCGLEDAGKTGERMTFAEQQERKAERAEHRAERYDARSERAAAEGARLQKPIEDMHGDIAFFTQPNINTSAGRAFTNRRNRMFAAWERGFDEFKKSEYYADAAETARQTAAQAKAPTSKGFCQRRIDDAEKAIRAQTKNLEHYRARLEQIDAGKEVKRYNGEIVTREEVENWIETAEELIQQNIEKSIYYHECMENIGGETFSKDNINVGDIVKIERFGACKVLSTGPKNIVAELRRIGSSLKFSYAEITEVIEHAAPKDPNEVKAIEHPFVVGDEFSIEIWDSKEREYVPAKLEVVNVSAERVTVRINGGKAKSVKPYKAWYNGGMNAWTIQVKEALHNIYKPIATA